MRLKAANEQLQGSLRTPNRSHSPQNRYTGGTNSSISIKGVEYDLDEVLDDAVVKQK